MKDERGWLVNGVSALMHLICASLKISQKRSFHFDWSQLQEASAPYTSSAAEEVLSNKVNLKLRISLPSKQPAEEVSIGLDEVEHETFGDRVEEFYSVLERMIRYQEDVEREEYKTGCSRPRKLLEGWDFVDFASQRDPLQPCRTTLPTVGKAWVDFLRSISAITLFGQGFGELIQPWFVVEPGHAQWSELPKKKYYIAVSHSDIKAIMELHGHPYSNPMRLSNSIIWHTPRTNDQGMDDLVDVRHVQVQVPWPAKLRQSLETSSKYDDLYHPYGAVIFGYNDSFHWHWKDAGDPVPGPAPNPETEFEDPFQDSGLGTSLDASTSAMNLSTQALKSTDRSSDPEYHTSPENVRKTYGNSDISGGKNQFGDIFHINYNMHQSQRESHITVSGGPSGAIHGPTQHQQMLEAQSSVSKRRKPGSQTGKANTALSPTSSEAGPSKKQKITLLLYPSQGKIKLKGCGKNSPTTEDTAVVLNTSNPPEALGSI